MATYEVLVLPFGGGEPVAVFGEVADPRQKASIRRVSWVLNQPGSMTFRAPIDHPATAAVDILRCEIEVRRNAAMIWRGIPLQRQRSGGAVDFTCAGLLWPFTRWHVGPNDFDFLGGRLTFEDGLTGWTAVDCTAATTTSLIRAGSTAALVTATEADADSYIETTVTVNAGSIGLYLEVAAEYHIDLAVPWIGPAIEERGLYIAATNSAQGEAWEPITNSSPRGVWYRVTTGIHLLPDLVDEMVTIRCYAPGGRIAWDNGTVKAEKSISSHPAGTDAAVMFARLVDYCQTEKTDVGLARDTPTSGALVTDVYQMYALPNVFELMESFPARGLLDYAVIDRTITTFAPRRGSYKPAQALTVAPDAGPPNVTTLSYDHRINGASTATQVVRTGAGSGATRDIYQATDTSAIDGLVLEDIGAVPQTYGPAGARQMAQTDLARLRDAVTIPSAKVPADGWLGVLVEGDTTDVVIDDGAVQEVSVRRVLSVDLDPATDTLTYGLADEADTAG